MTHKKTCDAERIAVIENLLRASRCPIGRTAIMKCLYFLQEVEGLPLGYRFQLYTYGPYDPRVLTDLDMAEALGRLRSKLTVYGNGNEGYLYSVKTKQSADIDAKWQEAIERVVRNFACRTVSDLEAASTIVFVDHYHFRREQTIDEDALVNEITSIKSHLTPERVRGEIEKLRNLGYLKALP